MLLRCCRAWPGKRLAFDGVDLGLRGYPFALFVLIVSRSIDYLAIVSTQSLMLFSTVLHSGAGHTRVQCLVLVLICAAHARLTSTHPLSPRN